MEHEPRSLGETVQWLRTIRASLDSDQHYRYGIFDAARDLVGEVMLIGRGGDGALELGYWLHVDQVGQGYAAEASAALTRVAFELRGVDRVEIQCEPENVRSGVLASRLGYNLEATLRRRANRGDMEPKDLQVWTLFRSEYEVASPGQDTVVAYDCLGEQIL